MKQKNKFIVTKKRKMLQWREMAILRNVRVWAFASGFRFSKIVRHLPPSQFPTSDDQSPYLWIF